MTAPTFRRVLPGDTYEVRVDGVLIGTVERMPVEHGDAWSAFRPDGTLAGNGMTRGHAARTLDPHPPEVPVFRSRIQSVPRLDDLKWEAPDDATLGVTALVVSENPRMDGSNDGTVLISTPTGEIKLTTDRHGRVFLEPMEPFAGRIAAHPASSSRIEISIEST